MTRPIDRRVLLQGAAASALLPLAAGSVRGEDKLKGNIKQSIVFWCFNSAGQKWSLEKTCQVAKSLGCPSVELVPPADWGVLKKHGLVCAIAPNGMPGAPFMKGFNILKYHEQVIATTKKTIDACADGGCPSVIVFSG